MKILITGGNGFIGKNLCKYLVDHITYSPTRQELDLLNTDKVTEYLKTNKPDVVIHTANHDSVRRYNNNDPKDTVYNNTKMFFNIVNNSQYYGRLISLGSGSEYGGNTIIVKENQECIPNDYYGFSKYIISQYSKSLKNTTILRLFGVYGQYDDWTVQFISNACYRTIWQIPIIVKSPRVMSFVYVKDLCEIVLRLIESNLHGIYNVCNTECNNIVDIATYVASLNNNTVNVIDNIVQPEYTGSNDKLKKELKLYDDFFHPITTGIKELFEWCWFHSYSYDKDFLLRQN